LPLWWIVQIIMTGYSPQRLVAHQFDEPIVCWKVISSLLVRPPGCFFHRSDRTLRPHTVQSLAYVP
jgi:hypothetical protein